jgi:DNA-binding HxlR family transcriptional regulator
MTKGYVGRKGVLRAIGTGRYSKPDLMSLTGLNKTRLRHILEELLQKGLIERTDIAGHGRDPKTKYYSLTDKGLREINLNPASS